MKERTGNHPIKDSLIYQKAKQHIYEIAGVLMVADLSVALAFAIASHSTVDASIAVPEQVYRSGIEQPGPAILEPFGREVDGVTVFNTTNGLPGAIEVPSGETFYINPSKVEIAREKAVAGQNYQLVDIFSRERNAVSDASFSYFMPMEDHPILSELPKDVLTDEQLSTKGIKIIQGNYTQFFIRQNAFEKDGIFTSLNDGTRNITFILVDSFGLFQEAVPEKRYDSVRDLLPKLPDQALQEAKAKMILKARTRVEEQGRQLKDKEIAGYDISSLDQYSYLVAQTQLAILENGIISKKDLSRYTTSMFRNSDSTDVQTYFRAGGMYTRSIDGYDSVFLESGGCSATIYYAVFVDSNGKPSIITTNDGVDVRNDWGFQDQYFSCPNPDQIPSAPDILQEQGYLKDAGIILSPEHEATHLIYGDSIGTGAIGERHTEEETLKRLRKAWTKWENSGFTDNTGYPFVIKIPNWEVDGPKGYLISGISVPTTLGQQIA